MRDDSAPWVGAIVVLVDGQRVGWKIIRGSKPPDIVAGLSSRYTAGRKRADCDIQAATFDDPDAFRDATLWAAEFPGHPDEAGGAPEHLTHLLGPR